MESLLHSIGHDVLWVDQLLPQIWEEEQDNVLCNENLDFDDSLYERNCKRKWKQAELSG